MTVLKAKESAGVIKTACLSVVIDHMWPGWLDIGIDEGRGEGAWDRLNAHLDDLLY